MLLEVWVTFRSPKVIMEVSQQNKQQQKVCVCVCIHLFICLFTCLKAPYRPNPNLRKPRDPILVWKDAIYTLNSRWVSADAFSLAATVMCLV